MQATEELRKAAYAIDPIYTKRWSPRSFLKKEVPDELLNRVLEAARWAPSAANMQPWHFIIAKSTEDRERFLSFINDGNTAWCKQAPVLIAIVSKTDSDWGVNRTHAFDTGAAWGYLALETARQGLVVHAMGGFDKEKAVDVLNIPDNYDIHAIAALGYQGEKSLLPELYQEREKPSDRKAIHAFTHTGTF